MRTFYIAGCQRSGTTLMRLVLESHSQLFCFDEADTYRLLIDQPVDAYRAEVDLPQAAAVGFKIPRFAEQLLQDEMSDVDFGRFPSFYRGGPIVFLRRDVLDVVASMQSLTYPDGETWIAKFGRKILIDKFASPAFRERYRAELQQLEERGFPDHLVGALYWKYKTDACCDYLAAGLPVLDVRYEDLVADPARQLRRVVDGLGVEWQAGLLDHPKFAHRELDDDGKAIGGTDPQLAIHSASVGRYKAAFDPVSVAEIVAMAAPTAGPDAGSASDRHRSAGA